MIRFTLSLLAIAAAFLSIAAIAHSAPTRNPYPPPRPAIRISYDVSVAEVVKTMVFGFYLKPDPMPVRRGR